MARRREAASLREEEGWPLTEGRLLPRLDMSESRRPVAPVMEEWSSIGGEDGREMSPEADAWWDRGARCAAPPLGPLISSISLSRKEMEKF